MAKTSIKDLQCVLFDAMYRTLNPDPDAPFTTEQARTIVSLAETVVDAGRAEIEYLKALSHMSVGAQDAPTALFLNEKNP